jgi:hypothetical protein
MLKNIATALALLAALHSPPARADDGHDPGAAPAAATGAALPRFAASSDLFELVGVVSGRQLTVFVDRFSDNAPVKGAAVELEVGAAKVALTERAEGEFTGTLAHELKPGISAVTATVVAGNDTDILAADLDVPDETTVDAAPRSQRNRYALGAAAGVAAVAALAWLASRRLARRRAGGAA